MPTPQWARIVNTTTQEYMREEEVNVIRDRKLLALAESRGRITFNHSGQFADWKTRYRRAPLSGYADGDTLTFGRQNRWKTAQQDWRGYTATDSITILEELQNKGEAAIIKFAGELAGLLVEDITENFGDEFYVDGGAAGNSKRIHGIESFLGQSGAQTAGFVATPNSTYAGLSCALGNYGGSWSTDGSGNINWPTGSGDYHYDFWSPLIVDYSNNSWAASTKTWVNTCREAIRYGIIKSRRNKSKKGMLDLILLENELYRNFEDKVEANERLVVNRGETKKGGLTALGFGDTLNYDGVDITYEYGIPTAVGYGFAMGGMEICCLQDKLFVVRGPDDDISGLSKRMAITFFGNIKWNPRMFAAWKKVS
jgi:hypothetical protein